ncbi:MAG TPA: dihydropteroate synthase [Desulfopila sp.]|nr:dihydropteroate synthase [Desulfopila sp.]
MKIVGILNVTPDSFSDGGRNFSLKNAVAKAQRMVEEGVDIIDIGGESTRPFAEPVEAHEELRRVLPVIEAIRTNHRIPISIDTTKAVVARQALDTGADIINDVSALQQDAGMIELVKATSAPVILMHRRGTPANMQIDPVYDDVVSEIILFFQEKLSWLQSEGVNLERVIIDPGIGFGKKLEHNLSILKHLERFRELGQPVLLGHSRKRFLGELTGRDMQGRDLPTAVVSALALSKKIDMVRVHNVAASRDAIRVTQAVMEAV